MSLPSPQTDSGASDPVAAALADAPGWRRRVHRAGELWIAGYLHPAAGAAGEAEAALADALSRTSDDGIPQLIDRIDGHFAFLWRDAHRTVAAVDPIAAVPLAWRSEGPGKLVFAASARRLLRAGDTPDGDAALSLGMAGFTFGEATLFPAVRRLGAGCCLIHRRGQDGPDLHRYARYLPRPDGGADGDPPARRRALADLTLGVMEKTLRGLNGRTIVAPLSAGLDSRLIVSALKELGCDRVVCISYGRRGNHEAAAARRIAAHLGYPWRFIEHTPAQQAQTFASERCRRFVDFADNLAAMPFQQDFHAVETLSGDPDIPADAVFINGQSGDFIAGNHIPGSLAAEPPGDLFEAAAAKHLSLWGCLKTPENLARIQTVFERDLDALAGTARGQIPAFGLYEASEYANRQSKYVVAGQRTYEWFGFDWRLPLWDRALIDFFETASLSEKHGERLYRDMLFEANWGGVWGPGWVQKRLISPAWVRPLRLAAKAAHAPLGRPAWHAFERRWFNWLIDPVANYAIAPYARVRRDRRGHRNAISWHAERYLQSYGLGIFEDGRVDRS